MYTIGIGISAILYQIKVSNHVCLL